MQYYKYLHVAVVIWSTLVNTQTHIQTDKQVLNGYVLLAQRTEPVFNSSFTHSYCTLVLQTYNTTVKQIMQIYHKHMK